VKKCVNDKFRIVIPGPILDYANFTYKAYVPDRRASGFLEQSGQKRGQGDLLALIGSLLIYDLICKHKKVCQLEMTSGDGDSRDISVRIGGKFRPINIKTSAYGPYRDGLNLFVKEEEIGKDFFAFIQCFVHIDEEPHVHIPGGLSVKSRVWEKFSGTLSDIPNTGGHRGIKISCEKLYPFKSFLEIIDRKF